MSKKVAIIVSSRHLWIAAAFSGVREAGMSPIICQSAGDVATECETFASSGFPAELILVDGAFPLNETRLIRKTCFTSGSNPKAMPPVIIEASSRDEIRDAIVREVKGGLQAMSEQ